MKKILIVEDVEMNIDLLTQLLEDDYELVIARDGAQGVTLAEQERPTAILMDMSLPVMDVGVVVHHQHPLDGFAVEVRQPLERVQHRFGLQRLHQIIGRAQAIAQRFLIHNG